MPKTYRFPLRAWTASLTIHRAHPPLFAGVSMKPAFRSTGYALPSVVSATITPHIAEVPRGSWLPRIGARVVAWWRDHQERRAERMRIEALAPLDPHTLKDLGISEDLRWRAQAQRESQQAR